MICCSGIEWIKHRDRGEEMFVSASNDGFLRRTDLTGFSKWYTNAHIS
jgi:hypothetical protein